MVDMLKLGLKTNPRCHRSLMMPSINKRHPHKVHSRDIQTNKHSPSLNLSLVLSHPHQTSSLPTTPRIPNNAMRIIVIIISNMACSKEHRAKKVQRLSKDRTADTMDHRATTPPSSPRALHNRPNLVMQQLVKVRTAVTLLPIPQPKPNNQELLQMLSHSLDTSNNRKLATIRMDILITLAHTMLHI